MRKKTFHGILAIISISSLLCIPVYSDGTLAPKVFVPQTKHHAGIVCPHEIVEHDFFIKNTGNAPLAYCEAAHCAGRILEVTILEPGEEAFIHIKSVQKGDYSVKYVTNDPDNPEIIFQIEKRQISYANDPKTLECVEGVALEQAKFKILHGCISEPVEGANYLRPDCRGFTITSIEDKSGYVTWELQPEVGVPVEKGSDRYSLTINTKSDIPYGRYEGELCVRHDERYCPEFIIKYKINNHHRVEITPTKIGGYEGLPLFDAYSCKDIRYFDQPVIWITTYYDDDAKPFEITDMICDIDVLKPHYESKDNRFFHIYLKPSAEYYKRKEVSGTLTIKTNDKLYPEFVIPINLKRGVKVHHKRDRDGQNLTPPLKPPDKKF